MASDKVHVYNPRKTTTVLGGSHIVTGFSEDSFVSVEPDGDGNKYDQGCDGETVISVDPTDVHKISLKLQQTSETNAYLNTQYEKLKNGEGGVFAVQTSDLLGKEQFSANNCFVSKRAKWERGKDQKERDWEIVALDAKFETT